jgi:CDP-6-deoxy-D-xylo-4-hexulose-3-dehydrase
LVEDPAGRRWLVIGESGPERCIGLRVVAEAGDRPDALELISDDCPAWPIGWAPRAAVLTQESNVMHESDLQLLGATDRDFLVRVMRARLATDVDRFFAYRHVRPPFDPASPSVPYAGRVFDEHELQMALDATLEFGLTLGEHGVAFSRDLATYLGVDGAVLVNSGSSANLVAVSALTSPLLGERALRPGDEVLTTAGGFPTTLTPILQAGLVAVLVDNDASSGNVNIEQLAEAVTARTRAVVLAHTLGNPFDVRAVEEICDRHGLWLVEDNCDALGSRYDGRLTGSFGDLSSQSFYPGHHITMGEGGAVGISRHRILARAVESFRDWGRDCWCAPGQDNACGKRFDLELGTLPRGYDHKFTFSHLGYNLKPTEWQAAIGRAQLSKLERFVAARRHNWDYLSAALADLEEAFELPTPTPRSEPSWFGFKLMVRKGAPFTRDEVVRSLEREGIQTRMLLGGNLVRQPVFQRLLTTEPGRLRVAGPLDGADRLMSDGFFIGVYPGLTEPHLEHVAEVTKRLVATSSKAAS